MKGTSCTTEVYNHTKKGTCSCNPISNFFVDATKNFNFQLQEKYFGQIVKLFWVISVTNQESLKCLLQIELKSSVKIL